MRCLVTKVLVDGSDMIECYSTEYETNLPENISWELRFYCDYCGDEVVEVELESHECENWKGGKEE